jgi:hypothetical protein
MGSGWGVCGEYHSEPAVPVDVRYELQTDAASAGRVITGKRSRHRCKARPAKAKTFRHELIQCDISIKG